MPRVSCVSGNRQTRMSVRARKRSSPSAPEKVAIPSTDRGERLQPATSKPITCELPGGVLPKHAEPHDADPDVVRAGLEAVVEPQLLPLLRVIGALAAQMHQAVQHDVLAHAVRQVVIDDAHHRHGRQLRVAHEMVDPGAEREQHLQVRQGREASRRVLPGGDVPDFGRD